jgi:protein O-mannosyl-transferase
VTCDDADVSSISKKDFGFASSRLLQGALMVLLVFLVYFPALRGGFLWDDDTHISANLTLRSLKGLWEIWFKPAATCQYYPLTFSVFWVGYHLWGLNPLGYHMLNVVLHGMAAVLLWQVLARLRVRGAGLAGAVFALHPVCVMSVAWMTELKNTLSGVLALGAGWAYVRFARLGVYGGTDQKDRPAIGTGLGREWRYYILALVLFQLALLAKTAVSFLPVTLLLVVWWQRERLTWREVWPLLPMVGIAVMMGEVTIYLEHFEGASGQEFSLGWWPRVLISGRSFWFYLGKLFLPDRLRFIYERWQVDAGVWWQNVFPGAVIGLLGGLWSLRGRIGKGAFVALLHFYISTSFLILVVVLYMTRFSFVSDHWQYFGCMSVIALAAAGITGALDFLQKDRRVLKITFCGMLLLVLGVLTWRQAGTYAHAETFWRTIIARNPDCWMAHDNLGIGLLGTGKVKEAMDHFRKSIELNPNGVAAHNDYSVALRQCGRLDEAKLEAWKALALAPNTVEPHINLVKILRQGGELNEAVAEYKTILQLVPASEPARIGVADTLCLLGRSDEAIPYYREVLEANPDNAVVRTKLGLVLMEQGDLGAAGPEFSSVLQADPRNAKAIDGLGYVLAMQGRLDEARARFLEAMQLDPQGAYPHLHYAMSLSAQRQAREAVVEYRKALALDDQLSPACNNLAWMLASHPDPQIRNGREAVELAERACRLTNNEQPFYLGTLAAAYAEAGRFNDAIAMAEKARDLARKAGMEKVAERNEQLLEIYRTGRPYHESAEAN